MRFHYISPSILPSRSANSVHVVWQCDGLCRSGAEVTLYAKRTMPEAQQLESALSNVYGVAHPALHLDTVFSNSRRGESLYIAYHAVRKIGHDVGGDAILSRNLYAAFVLAVLRKIPLLFETHQLETGFRKRMQRAIMRCPWVTTIVISDHLAKYLPEHHGVTPHRTLVLHDAAPSGISSVLVTERRSQLHSLVPEADGSWKQVCGYFGHLYPGRGIEIVEAMAAARKDCLFLIYGGTETDIAVRRASNRQANLVFMGHVPHPVARDLMRIVDMLLMPYQESVSIGVAGHDTARWMSPMKMFEYLGAGVPIISSDLPVLREVLLDGENCLLARPSDIDSWLAALDRIAGNPELAARLGSNAHDQYERQHTWTRRAEKIIEAARKL
jgi:glycosyltransferase involved in cell wall biosynthesis